MFPGRILIRRWWRWSTPRVHRSNRWNNEIATLATTRTRPLGLSQRGALPRGGSESGQSWGRRGHDWGRLWAVGRRLLGSRRDSPGMARRTGSTRRARKGSRRATGLLSLMDNGARWRTKRKGDGHTRVYCKRGIGRDQVVVIRRVVVKPLLPE